MNQILEKITKILQLNITNKKEIEAKKAILAAQKIISQCQFTQK